jgi:hypothetical protein
MTYDEIIASQAKLTEPLVASDRRRNLHTLATVGEAAHFILSNVSAQHSADYEWQLAAASLKKAAETDEPAIRAAATKAVRKLLRSEKLLVSAK